MIYCPNCGMSNRDGSRFCNECGQRLFVYEHCPQCGLPNASTVRFCSHCGAEIKAKQAPAGAAVVQSPQPNPLHRDGEGISPAAPPSTTAMEQPEEAPPLEFDVPDLASLLGESAAPAASEVAPAEVAPEASALAPAPSGEEERGEDAAPTASAPGDYQERGSECGAVAAGQVASTAGTASTAKQPESAPVSSATGAEGGLAAAEDKSLPDISDLDHLLDLIPVEEIAPVDVMPSGTFGTPIPTEANVSVGDVVIAEERGSGLTTEDRCEVSEAVAILAQEEAAFSRPGLAEEAPPVAAETRVLRDDAADRSDLSTVPDLSSLLDILREDESIQPGAMAASERPLVVAAVAAPAAEGAAPQPLKTGEEVSDGLPSGEDLPDWLALGSVGRAPQESQPVVTAMAPVDDGSNFEPRPGIGVAHSGRVAFAVAAAPEIPAPEAASEAAALFARVASSAQPIVEVRTTTRPSGKSRGGLRRLLIILLVVAAVVVIAAAGVTYGYIDVSALQGYLTLQ